MDSIANDYFNTNQHYDYEDAIIIFYINFNLDRVYYFDHTHINTEPYILPVSPDSNRVLIIRFDIIINDPIEFVRLIEWPDKNDLGTRFRQWKKSNSAE